MKEIYVNHTSTYLDGYYFGLWYRSHLSHEFTFLGVRSAL